MAERNWSNKDKDLIREMLRHGESRLSAQLQLATSADQRATALAGIYVAVATGIIGALAANLFADASVFQLGAAFAAVLFLIAAVLCILATLPVRFMTPGNDPASWYSDIDNCRPEEEVLGEQAEHFNAHILDNRVTIERNAKKFLWGALLGVFAPILAALFSGVICLLKVA